MELPDITNPKNWAGRPMEPCANQRMDEWEDKNLPPEQRRQPRLLYCGCPRCNGVTC